jgi:N4-gp56 family major capsid protein
MSQTVIPAGHPLARKLYSVAAFAAAQRAPSFSKNLVGSAPKQSDAERRLRGQTSPDYPIVRVTDLSKGGGDKISVDIYNAIGGKPTMGDKKLAGNMSNLSFGSMEISINQVRKGVDPGGRMTQQRTVHNLRTIGVANLAGWWGKYTDQTTLVHLAGARGFQPGADWVVPLESDADFAEIMVNPVLPPSPGRRFFAGDATSVANLDSTDYLKLKDIDKLRASLDEMAFPLAPIKLPDDPAADDEPLYCLFVTPRQWYWLMVSTDPQNWRTFLANAHQRGSWSKHPLFRGTGGMWNGILIKKMRRCVRFPAGSTVREYAAGGVSISNATAAVDTDRAILLGAQALGWVYGRHQNSDYYMNWHEEKTDHGNTMEISVAAMFGASKLKFKDQETGVPEDYGVCTLDSYAPTPV